MLQISAADILKIVLPTVITLFIAVVKTLFAFGGKTAISY